MEGLQIAGPGNPLRHIPRPDELAVQFYSDLP